MELIYTDAAGVDINPLLEYKLDEAFGYDENNFELTIARDEHCCLDGYMIYAEGTEYGGVIDCLKPDNGADEITYRGRSWHGVLEGHVIDSLDLYGDANEVLGEVIEYLGVTDIFSVASNMAEIEIVAHSIRHAKAYSAVCSMLAEADAKLQIRFVDGKAQLSAVPLVDYSEDEEFDTSQVQFQISKNYHPLNHVVCIGEGEEGEAYEIHVFADSGGGVQAYATTEEPLQDSDYILSKENQVQFGRDEIADVVDVGSVSITKNYILLSEQPADWRMNYADYYAYDAEEDRYDSVKGNSDGTKYTLLSEQPADWAENYGSYSEPDGKGGYKGVEGVTTHKYTKTKKQPKYWKNAYMDYFYPYYDGTSTIPEYRSVEGITKEWYKTQTRVPSDWKSNFRSYYERSKGKYRSVTGVGKNRNKAPKWKAKKYYTKKSKTVPPKWLASYCSRTTTVTPPAWKENKYYSSETRYTVPPFAQGHYYRQVLDHYAGMVEKAIEEVQNANLNAETIEIDLDGGLAMYDIGDIVGAIDSVTGIEVWQPITKKIVTINNNDDVTITYEIGTTR